MQPALPRWIANEILCVYRVVTELIIYRDCIEPDNRSLCKPLPLSTSTIELSVIELYEAECPSSWRLSKKIHNLTHTASTLKKLLISILSNDEIYPENNYVSTIECCPTLVLYILDFQSSIRRYCNIQIKNSLLRCWPRIYLVFLMFLTIQMCVCPAFTVSTLPIESTQKQFVMFLNGEYSNRSNNDYLLSP